MKSRFIEGDPGRTQDMVSEQTRLRLVEHYHSPKMKEIRKKMGRRLGKSGLGNKKRWG